MTTQTPVTAEIEKWFRIRVRFFPNFWLRVRFRRKNAKSRRSWLRLSWSGPISGLHVCSTWACIDWLLDDTRPAFFFLNDLGLSDPNLGTRNARKSIWNDWL